MRLKARVVETRGIELRDVGLLFIVGGAKEVQNSVEGRDIEVDSHCLNAV